MFGDLHMVHPGLATGVCVEVPVVGNAATWPSAARAGVGAPPPTVGPGQLSSVWIHVKQRLEAIAPELEDSEYVDAS